MDKTLCLLLVFLNQVGLPLVDAADFNDTISCEDFPSVENITGFQLEEEAMMLGQCIPYTADFFFGPRLGPCDRFYTIDVDTVYLPNGRADDSLTRLNEFAANVNPLVDMLRPQCVDPVVQVICYYYYPPCGNITQFEPPNAVCQDVCLYLTTELCQQEWLLALQFLAGLSEFVELLQIQFLNCSQPGAALGDLPHCCSDAGVTIEPAPNDTFIDLDFDLTDTPTTVVVVVAAVAVVAASVSASVAVLLGVVGVGVPITVCLVVKRRRKKSPRLVKGKPTTTIFPEIMVSADHTPPVETQGSRYVPVTAGLGREDQDLPLTRARVGSGFIRNLTQSKLLIPGRHLQLLDTVGQGEFGVVYRGHLTGWCGRTTAELVAVKTLKNLNSASDADNLMKESEKMEKFEHTNVLNLIGVCIDAGEAPYIVMPYMANGSLLAYLRKERPHLSMAEGAGDEVVAEAQRKLLSMCLQIAKGMSYLAEQKFVHRDLAARNCMIDQNFVIKVADFGLSEDIYSRNYFRQGQVDGGESVKLPIRWMALESLLDCVFTEKTDVWSYGVTCWEVFSLGHTPYPAIDPFALIKFLQSGERLEEPTNAACTPQVYELIGQCWTESPDKRPSFRDLSQAVNSLLEGIAGYLDFSAISSGAGQTGRYDHLEKRVVNDHLEHEEKQEGNHLNVPLTNS